MKDLTMSPFEITISVKNSNDGYLVTVALESKDRLNPITVSRKKLYADLSDISDVRQEAIAEYNLKEREIQ